MTTPAPVRLSTLPAGARVAFLPAHLAHGPYYVTIEATSVRAPDGVVMPAYGDPAVYVVPEEPSTPIA